MLRAMVYQVALALAIGCIFAGIVVGLTIAWLAS